MSAFLPTPPLPPLLPRARRSHIRLTAPPPDGDAPSPVSLDTLSGFESFCWRTQDWLCAQAAAADGLGTFHSLPSSYTAPRAQPARLRHRVMRGGRAFDTAVVAVWSSAGTAVRRRRTVTCVDRRTARVEYAKEAVGVSVKLSPRDPAKPALRADAHYFQIGGGRVAWWFSGTADLSLGPAAHPAQFGDCVMPFLDTWDRLRRRHRAAPDAARRSFLDDCWGVGSEPGEGGEGGTVGGIDRMTAFGFITEVVDALLPAYLPLLAGAGPRDRFAAEFDEGGVWAGQPVVSLDLERGFGEEEVDKFCISGGAACESVTVRASPLGSWRFSLAPSTLTSAGKAYATLRNDHRSVCTPLLYI